MSNANDIALAAQVAIGGPDRWGDRCPAWIESKNRMCGRLRAQGYLCKLHNTVATRRLERATATTKAKREAIKQKRQERYNRHIDKWREQLKRVDAELERRTGSPSNDRAAYGGNVHPSIRRKQEAQFSDSNVKRVGELLELKRGLEREIGWGEPEQAEQQA
ncbi:hypothetical protein [Corynebacterium lubricantis]|uniref:hypothetical protein n=1 Tax=Corynebacterium lubricantis TaxID=541095 RepID=UPI0003827A4F|nr:hypothetical protein [Corynebacterium lubricantis]